MDKRHLTGYRPSQLTTKRKQWILSPCGLLHPHALALALQGNSLKRRFPMLLTSGSHSHFICCDAHALVVVILCLLDTEFLGRLVIDMLPRTHSLDCGYSSALLAVGVTLSF
ncbi:hypothetical protein Csa_007375 [Cucumis sativus]|uniref:Uncharacterized protein n=1 Tax=Cucumis sativus TaxID=3659 RepID=A0A0A0M0A5_CUCSA|nr:hypothetical protein Csa_007375 [Cucumis sativus]